MIMQLAACLTADDGREHEFEPNPCHIIVAKVNHKINQWPFLPYTEKGNCELLADVLVCHAIGRLISVNILRNQK